MSAPNSSTTAKAPVRLIHTRITWTMGCSNRSSIAVPFTGRLLMGDEMRIHPSRACKTSWQKATLSEDRMKANGAQHRIELGQFIVADSKICQGQPTCKGTRIMAWLVLQQVERGMSWDDIAEEWDGRVSFLAIAETIALSHLIEKDKPFQGFHARPRRKHSRQSTA